MHTRDRVERKALKYLYGNADRMFLPRLDFRLYAKEKYKSYGEHLEIFKKLFNSGDKELQMALWNAMSGIIVHDFAKADFSDEEAAFLTRFSTAAKQRCDWEQANSNRPFSTERLTLSPAVKLKELKLYHRHLREDGDFSLYTGRKLTRDNLNLYDLDRPYCFAVYEKKSGQMVGMVGLHSYEEEKNMARAEWYIFKPYRKRDYATEAVLALAKRAFSGKLFEWRETNWKYLYKKHYAKIDLIRAYIRETNFASQRLAERCKFEEQYTEGRHFLIEGSGYEDAKIYELTPEELAEGTPIKIPDGTTEIKEGQFRGDSSISSVTIPDGVTKIGDRAFENCTRLSQIILPDSVTEIGAYAFSGCKSLTEITLPAGLKEIGNHAFLLCTSLKSIKIPEGITKLNNHTFTACTHLTQVDLPDSITEIERGAFSGCCHLKHITIPKQVTVLEFMFAFCDELESITIPASVKEIKNGLNKSAFTDCANNLTIHAPKGSYAEQYAMEHHIRFVAE